MTLTLYFRDPHSPDTVIQRTFEPASFTNEWSIWDIGFFIAPYFIETNMFMIDTPNHLQYFS